MKNTLSGPRCHGCRAGRRGARSAEQRPSQRRGRGVLGRALGDVPYSDAQQTVGVPNLIADMNRSRLAFSAHVGDLKQGSGSPCDDALYVRSEGYFNTLRAPAMYTPGDNGWTDCDRASTGGYDSFERLTHIRNLL